MCVSTVTITLLKFVEWNVPKQIIFGKIRQTFLINHFLRNCERETGNQIHLSMLDGKRLLNISFQWIFSDFYSEFFQK